MRVLLPIALLSTVTWATEVQLGKTTLTGTNILDVLEFYGGIPFAEPPLGDLRLSPPVLKPALDVPTFNATQSGPKCLQIPVDTTSSEDCLTVDIRRPVDSIRGNQLLPVMVFIYGGGFVQGSSTLLDGSPLVLRSITRGTPVIYVSFNYRLGPLGFPQGAEAEQRGALNLGLKDQLAALDWIKRNIAAFGGDPTKVTVFGESAGAVSINILSLTSGLENFARGAILESGGAGTIFHFEASRRQSLWDSYVRAVPECSGASANDTFTCLRTASSETLSQAGGGSLAAINEMFPWIPTLDGPGGVFPELASSFYAKGQFSRIPFISGVNLDEDSIAAPLTFPTISSSDTIFNAIITNYTTNTDGTGNDELQAAANQLLQLYPDVPALGSPYNTGNETFGLSSQYKRSAAITGDLMFHSVRRLWTKAAVDAGVKAYGYLFTGPRLEDVFPPQYGVPHTQELYYVFGLVPEAGGSQRDVELKWKMMDYWISFAVTLDPNDGKGTSRPTWPEYATCDPVILELNTNNISAIPDNYRTAGIDFINSNPVLFRH
ncbi:hypothetical protein VNI00_009747 [Paramarasmius palmivorus]|uniref:Carboxylic ester hydrolase n=1 Tax=Paramarasmius palmivorus TaxID=297713 RepID=A0AAW0CQU0_9AGAR